MKKIFSLMAAALMSVAMLAGENDLLWDYTEGAPSSSPDNGLYFNNKVNDAAGTNNGLKGIKLNSSGYCCFTKAAVPGKLKLSFGPRSGSNAADIEVWNWSGDASAQTKGDTKYATTGQQTEYGTQVIELTAEQNNIYLCRGVNTETALQKIQFVETVARSFVDFQIEFRNDPYTVIQPAAGLPEGVVVEGTTYNGGQHGVYGGSITVPVDGPVKFTIGACQYSGTPINVKKDGVDFATVNNNAACGETAGNYAQFVTYVYTGEAATLKFEIPGNTYVPYFFAEATDIMPCEIIFKDQNGTELSRVETYEGAALEALPEVSVLPEIGEGNAFRGWFYSSNKKAQVGDPITGNTTIQAKVTPIEVATVGSVQTYDFADPTFYPEDHELVEVANGAFHDATHGWYFGQNGAIHVYSPGTSVIVVTLCKYSESGTVNVTSGFDGHTVASMDVVKNETPDGTELVAQYSNGPAWVTISWTAKQYIHKVVVYNVEDFMEKDETTGYYMVPAGDVASFILALVQAESGEKIFLPNGIYDLGETCLTTISKNNISIVGQSMEGTIIKNAPDAAKESIDKTATIKINKNVSGTYLQDLTIQNALDYYKNDNGRAVALWDQGTQTVCKNVRLLSYQDTYYSNLQGAVKYFEDCEIHGTVDFICGDGSVYFKNNLLYCEKRKANGGGSDALTANNGPATDKGYVFESCTVKSECPVVSMGRAWNNTPSVSFLNTLVDYSAGEFGFESSDIQRWTKKLMNPNAWPQFGEYNTHLADGTVLTPASNVVTFVDEKSGNATQDIETVLSAENAATRTMEWTLGEWAATAKADATQAVCDLDNIDPNGVYLVEALNGNAELLTGAALMEEVFPEDSGITVRKANARGGFGPKAGEDPHEDITNTEVSNRQVTKIVRDGQLIIIRDNKEYNIYGLVL